MGFYADSIYPLLVATFENAPPIQVLRQELVPRAQGSVLEIGVGTGANFPYYDASKIGKLYALEPNAGMRRRAQERQQRTRLDVEFLSLPGERLPLPDSSIDSVVSTFTLCTIGRLEEALAGLVRVLKPGGLLLFLENSLAADLRVQRWQHQWEPTHRRVFAGLFLTRDIPSLISGAGFHIESLNTKYLSRFPKSWSHCCYGVAAKHHSP